MTAPVLYASDEHGIATLTLNLPEKLNPAAKDLLLALRDALARAADDRTVRAVVLTAAGRAFCAGADLSVMNSASAGSLGDQTADGMQAVSNPLISRLRTMPVPVVCAVNGPAAGAGVGLALACDVVLAAQSAYFYLPFLPKLGIVPDLGASWFLPRLVGSARALGLALLDEKLDADRAAQWGLIWAALPDAQLQERAQATARRLAALPMHAIHEAREAFAQAATNTLDAQLHYESERQRELIDRPEFSEGVQAFLQKRALRFRGEPGPHA